MLLQEITYLGYNVTIIGLIYLSIFFAFVIRVVTGFGSAIVLSPILSIIIQPKDAVILIILLESVINAIFPFKERIKMTGKEVYLGAFSGIMVGLLLFGISSHKAVGLGIGLSMAILSVVMLKGINFYFNNEKILFYFLGLISGSMGVLTGVNGPQIVLGLVNQRYRPDFIRVFIITYLIVIDTVTLIAFVALGYIKTYILMLFLLAIPFIILSYMVGVHILRGLHNRKLEKVILIIVFTSSLVLIFKSYMSF
jgi:hypothetical protein